MGVIKNFFKNNARLNIIATKKYLFLIIFLLFGSFIYGIIDHIKNQEIGTYEKTVYRENVLEAKVYLTTLIKEKQNSTATIGLGLLDNKMIIDALKYGQIDKNLLLEYSAKLAQNTDLKNVWFQLIDKNGISIQRSWSDLQDDNISQSRVDLQIALQKKEIINSISVGKFDLTFKMIVPIFELETNEFLGLVEVITHFHSIARNLSEKKIDAVIVADKMYKKQLTEPFMNIFIDNYYVVNDNAKSSIVKYLQNIDFYPYLQTLQNEDYFVDNKLQSVVSYHKIVDENRKHVLGHILLFQKLNQIDNGQIDYINYLYNIYFLFAIIVLVLVIYFSTTIEIKNLDGKSYLIEMVIFICIIYLILAFGIYKLIEIKYKSDIENYRQTLTSQTISEYNSITEKNKDVAEFIYAEVLTKPNIIKSIKARNREQLYKDLEESYKSLSIKYNVKQLHFHLPDSTSFLRLHSKDLFGDSLVGVRESIPYVNKTKKTFYGFEEGRVFNGFRYVFPMFDEKNNHIGSVEVSFDVKSFIDSYKKLFDSRNANFLISKNIFKNEVFKKREDNYKESPVDNFLFDKSVLEKDESKSWSHLPYKINKDIFYEITKKIEIGIPFSVYFKNLEEIVIIIPVINRLSGEVVASINISKDDKFIKQRTGEFNQLIAVIFIVLAFIMFFVYREFLSKKKAQIELENNQKIIDSQNSFIIITDGIEVKRVNQTFLDFFGYTTLKDFKKKHRCICDFFTYEEGKKYIIKQMGEYNWFEYLKNPINQERQVKILDLNNDEHIFYIEINFHNNLQDGNHILTFIDITRLKNIENQLFYSEKMASLGTMIGNIAHQWRQPLSIISTCASGISMKHEHGMLKDGDIEKMTDMIVKHTKHLSETIDTFRDFIKESSEKEHKVSSVSETIEATLSIVEASLKNNFITLKYESDGKNYMKNMAKGELSQVLTNLINNAKDVVIENDIEDKEIKVRLYGENGKIIISVSDNGGGINDKIIDKIFEPYFTTKHASQGTGLGLYICHKIVTESFGGKIYVKNQQFGAQFIIELPFN